MSADIKRRPEGALLRTYLTAAGMGADAISKPLIGVVTASTQVFSEKPDARELGGAAVSGIEQAGGVAVRWDTTRSPEQMAWGHADGYSFAWRDQLADLIESWTQQQSLDGLVLVGDAPETLAGMVMAAARLNISAMVVTTGPKRWEYSDESDSSGKKKRLSDPFELLIQVLFSGKKVDQGAVKLESFQECLLAKDNHASHALDLALEALGVCLPGMATAPAQSPKRTELARATGERIIALIKAGTSIRRVLSSNSLQNAIYLDAALGGSVDVAVHLMAIAHEAGINLTFDQFDKIAQETPQVCRIGGVGEKEPHRIEDLERAGGVWAIMNSIKNFVHPTTTLTGRGASELAKNTQIKDSHVILTKKPYRKQSGVGVLHGNFASNGAVFLLNQVSQDLASFQGPAVVFESEIEAAKSLSAGDIKKGSVIVVRGQGPSGGPGLQKLRILPALLESKGWNKLYPVITDGRLPDTPKGMFISLVSPEGATKGPLAVIKTDDQIGIDIKTRQLSVRLTDTDLRVRLARWQAPEGKLKRGFLDRYSRSVSEVHEGAVLK